MQVEMGVGKTPFPFQIPCHLVDMTSKTKPSRVNQRLEIQMPFIAQASHYKKVGSSQENGVLWDCGEMNMCIHIKVSIERKMKLSTKEN